VGLGKGCACHDVINCQGVGRDAGTGREREGRDWRIETLALAAAANGRGKRRGNSSGLLAIRGAADRQGKPPAG